MWIPKLLVLIVALIASSKGQVGKSGGRGGMAPDISQVSQVGKSKQSPDPCKNYKALTEAWRNTANRASTPYYCDNNIRPGWYRFSGPAGVRMPTKPHPNRCGTHAPIWMSGKHPTAAEGVVTRKACAVWFINTCYWSVNIQVKVCRGFYVYWLVKPPACDMAYCSEGVDECARKPCKHGTCENKDGGYKCTCSPGWTGQNCQQARPCREGWSEYSRHCYRLVREPVTWTEAYSQCRRWGADLVSIMYGGETRFIFEGIVKDGLNVGSVWIGLRWHSARGRWIWTDGDGSRVPNTNWAPGRPFPGWLRYYGDSRNCGAVLIKGRTERGRRMKMGQWTDEKCSGRLPYICKSPKRT